MDIVLNYELFFILTDEDELVSYVSEEDALKADADGEIAISVTTNKNGDWVLDAGQWFNSLGTCQLVVNSFDLEVCVKLFAKMIREFENRAAEGEQN